jgi:hypothetical protein
LLLAAIGGCTPLVIEQRYQDEQGNPVQMTVSRQLVAPPPTQARWSQPEQPALATRSDVPPALLTATTNPDGSVSSNVTAAKEPIQVAKLPSMPTPSDPPKPSDPVAGVNNYVDHQQFINRNKVVQASVSDKSEKTSAVEQANLVSKMPEPLVPPTNVVDLGNAPVVQQPAFRMVNTKKFTLNFEVKDVGVTGISTVDLWCTQDMRTWKKLDSVQQLANALVVEVKDEGTFGFTLVARNGNGLGKAPPQAGELPQVWVSVNTTPPAVSLSGVEMSLTTKAPSMIIRWTAKDRNFGPRPVTLSYAANVEGPWTLLSANVENTGRYEWPLPANVPGAMYVRVQAADLNGNVGFAQTENPIHLEGYTTVKAEVPPEAARPATPPPPAADPSRPSVSIIAVEPTQE